MAISSIFSRMCGHHQEVVAQRGAADVQLGAADDDAVFSAIDDVHVRVGIVLAGRCQAAVALGVGDALGDAHVGGDGIVHVRLQPVLVDRVDALEPRRRRQQCHERLVRDVEGEVHRVDHLGPLAQLTRRPGRHHQRVGGAGLGRVAAVVAVGDGPGRNLEGRFGQQVLDLAPLEVREPAVVQG
jgi:hypothetical protein